MRFDRLLLLAGLLIFLGFAVAPEFYPGSADGSVSSLLVFLWLVVVLPPICPLAAAILRLTTSKRLRLRTGVVLACLIIPCGALLTLIAAALSGPGAAIVSIQGGLLTLAIASSILLMVRDAQNRFVGKLALFGISLSAAAAIWSIASIFAVTIQSEHIARGDPFCVAHHGGYQGPITSFAKLRGFEFYTTRSGYKSTSRFFFHGVLRVETSEGNAYYNWSPRRFRFDPVPNEANFIVSLRSSCTPQADFWGRVSLI